MKLLLLAATAAVVSAKCANDCNSHGDCNAKNQCECHRNFFGPDCSQRLCPAGRAFIDSAVGDLNGDNSVGVDLVFAQGRSATPVSEVFSYQYGGARDSHDVTASWNEAHFYQECSSKGVCDTTTGECACFPGYEGAGCARKSCENDCSGHGACKNYQGTAYNMWDKEASLYCDCDAGYTGPGCEQRVCPSGVDPVQASNMDVSRMYRIAFRTLSVADGDFDASTFYKAPFGPVEWTITLTDEFGDEWTTPLLTTNYDVIVDASADTPSHSFPIITAASVDAGGSDVDSDFDVTMAANYNAYGDGSYHVADQVKTALESLPDGASGTVTVHEVYASPGVADATANLLSASYPAPFTGDNSMHLEFPFVCGPTDIYLTGEEATADKAAAGSDGAGTVAGNIGGCGVAIVDSAIGSGTTCTERSGNNDVNDFLEGTGLYDGATISSGVSSAALQVITGLDGTTVLADATSVTVLAQSVSAATAGGFPLYPDETIYYQYPHYSNSDDNTARFPLFEDLEESCTNDDGYYASNSQYYQDNFAFDTDGDTSITSTAGLSLFLYFNEPTIETAPRVDYTFNNRAANAFLTDNIFSIVDGAVGETIESINNGAGDYASHSLVRVNDVTGSRSWDVAYHGVRSYFLDDQSDTSSDVTNHVCSKRGLCDYSTGLCDCFSGFTGANCAEQNALAF